MNRHSKVNIRFRVGAFMFISLSCLFVYIVFMGHHRSFFNSTTSYKVHFQEVHGLFAGSLVTVNGIPAGHVDRIVFREDSNLVEVLISVLSRFQPSLTTRSSASLLTKGLLGDKYVSIMNKGVGGQVLDAGAFIATHSADNILGVLGDETHASGLSDMMQEVQIFLKSLNQERAVKKMSRAFGEVSAAFSQASREEVRQILSRLNSILKKIDEGEGTAGALINNKVVYDRVLSILGRRPYHRYLPDLLQQKNPQQPPSTD